MQTIDAPNLRSYLEQHASAYRTFREMVTNIGPTLDEWLLENGKPMGPLANHREHGLDDMRAKMCFQNAFCVAAYMERFIYCEGYGYTPGLIPVHHAWVIVRETREVLDPTWNHEGEFCPHCLGNATLWEDELEDEIDCPYCEDGSNSNGVKNRDNTEYIGIQIPDQHELIGMIMRKGTYGILPDCISEIQQKGSTHE